MKNQISVPNLIELLMLNDIEIVDYLRVVLSRHNLQVVQDSHTDKYIFGVPKDKCIPVILHAHWDVIGGDPKKKVIVTENGIISNSDGILGGDDRAGIGVILEVLARFNVKPFVLFTNYEEPGVTSNHYAGMREFMTSNLVPRFKDNWNLIISVDRKGHNEWVTYVNGVSTARTELEALLLDGGIVNTHGSSNDSELLHAATDTMQINMSCGYYKNHTADEFILLDSYINAIERLSWLLPRITKRYEHKYRAFLSTQNYSSKEKNVDLTCGYSVKQKCWVCKREDRVLTYEKTISAHVCYVCKQKLKTAHDGVNFVSVSILQREIEEERKKTRAANAKLKDIRPDYSYPPCPVCASNNCVTWSRDEIGFVCVGCTNIHAKSDGKANYDGRFWIGNNSAFYVCGDSIYTVTPKGKKLLNSEPANKSQKVKQCGICDRYVTTATPVTVYAATPVEMNVCSKCRREAAVALDGEVSTLP